MIQAGQCSKHGAREFHLLIFLTTIHVCAEQTCRVPCAHASQMSSRKVLRSAAFCYYRTHLLYSKKQSKLRSWEFFKFLMAICLTLTYGFWWNEPPDVQTAFTIRECTHCLDDDGIVQRDERLLNEKKSIQPDIVSSELVSPWTRNERHSW